MKNKKKLKEIKEGLDKFLGDREYEKLKDIERQLGKIKTIIDGEKPTDIRGTIIDEVGKLTREVKETKEISVELEKIETAINRLFEKPEKDYEKDFKKIVNSIREIEIPNLEKNTEKIVKAIKEELSKIRPRDYRVVLKQILDKINEFKKEGKEVRAVKVTNFPKAKTEGLLDKIIKKLTNPIETFVLNKRPEEAIPVVLTDKDRKLFYTALFTVYGSGGGADPVGLKDKDSEPINPAREDGNLADIKAAVESAVEEATTPTVYNVTMTNADTEYSQALPAGTKRFTLQCRGTYDIRYAFETGKVATPTAPYMTLKAGMVYYEDNLNLTSRTIYLACGTAGQVVEIICWT